MKSSARACPSQVPVRFVNASDSFQLAQLLSCLQQRCKVRCKRRPDIVRNRVFGGLQAISSRKARASASDGLSDGLDRSGSCHSLALE